MLHNFDIHHTNIKIENNYLNNLSSLSQTIPSNYNQSGNLYLTIVNLELANNF